MNYPSSWLAPQISGHSLQLIESQYRDHDSMYRDLTAIFGAVLVLSTSGPFRMMLICSTLTDSIELESLYIERWVRVRL